MKTKTIPTFDITCPFCGKRFVCMTAAIRVACPRCSCVLCVSNPQRAAA